MENMENDQHVNLSSANMHATLGGNSIIGLCTCTCMYYCRLHQRLRNYSTTDARCYATRKCSMPFSTQNNIVLASIMEAAVTAERNSVKSLYRLPRLRINTLDELILASICLDLSTLE